MTIARALALLAAVVFDVPASAQTTFELINAPPGSMQRMGIYFYATPLRAEPTRQAALAFTHDDAFKPVARYKTMVNHMHSTIKAQVMAQTTPELASDVVALRSTGANIVGDSERGNDIQGLADYAKALATQSDKDFLMLPWDEPGVQFGGQWTPSIGCALERWLPRAQAAQAGQTAARSVRPRPSAIERSGGRSPTGTRTTAPASQGRR